MTKSPIWGESFGGNGDKNGKHSVGHGHCVTDGPFANLTVRYFSAEEKPHCLSRGFLHGELLNERFGARVRPDALEAILDEPDYSVFNLKLEEGPHDAVPFGVRGDFSRETASNGR
jgi:tyrosinase